MESIICSECGKEKHVDDYYVIKKTGYRYKYCKKCHMTKTKPKFEVWRKQKRERFNELARNAMRKYKDRQTQGVYLVKTDKGFYVGCSSQIETRMLQHYNLNQLGCLSERGYTIEDWIILEEVTDSNVLFQVETKWIQMIQPEINILKKD